MIEVKKFSATWCGPCRMLTPVMDNVKSQTTDVNFRSIDIDEEYELASKYQVRSVPTVIIERDGQEVKRLVGLQSEYTYKNAINELKTFG